jgi:hypothetical protein
MKNKNIIWVIIGFIVLIGIVFALSRNAKPTIPDTNNQGTTTDITVGKPFVSDKIIVSSPLSNSVIESPLTFSGAARGSWYFEASFPVKILDGNGKTIASVPAQAKGDWMTNDFVPFEGTVTFPTPTTETGTVVFEKDNPSGLPQNADKVEIPVRFQKSTTAIPTVIHLYYPNKLEAIQIGDACSQDSILSVIRTIPGTKTPIQDTIRMLIEGNLTAKEKDLGFTTEFPHNGFKLIGTNLKDGTLTLEFSEVPGFTSGGSCRVGILSGSIIKTAKQFKEVKQVVFKPASLFQP